MNILEMAMAAKMGGGGTGGGSGGGSVNSVNGVKPDASGNVNVLAWEETAQTILVADATATITAGYPASVAVYAVLEEGKTYTVIWNGAEYKCIGVPYSRSGYDMIALGNLEIMGSVGGNGEPFVIGYLLNGAGYAVSASESGEYTFSIIDVDATIKTIEPKFLPSEEWVFTLEDGSEVTKKVVVAE